MSLCQAHDGALDVAGVRLKRVGRRATAKFWADVTRFRFSFTFSRVQDGKDDRDWFSRGHLSLFFECTAECLPDSPTSFDRSCSPYVITSKVMMFQFSTVRKTYSTFYYYHVFYYLFK